MFRAVLDLKKIFSQEKDCIFSQETHILRRSNVSELLSFAFLRKYEHFHVGPANFPEKQTV